MCHTLCMIRTMKLLFLSASDDPAAWTCALAAHLPDVEIRVWPDVGDPAEIDAALVWKPPAGELSRFTNLGLIVSLGMGVDHILADTSLPAGVPVVRVIDPSIVSQMGEYVTAWVLYFHRQLDLYGVNQHQHRWSQLPAPDTGACTVGVMGLGSIGHHVARTVASLGFPVIGWSRAPKHADGVEILHGPSALPTFLSRCRILVCLLPLTPQTAGIINADTLQLLPTGAYFINCARGGHVVEADLLRSLDSEQVAGAALDVFCQEPLPPEHPFWAHPRVHVTPHIAGLTNPRTAAPQVIENLRRFNSGQELLDRIDLSRGY